MKFPTENPRKPRNMNPPPGQIVNQSYDTVVKTAACLWAKTLETLTHLIVQDFTDFGGVNFKSISLTACFKNEMLQSVERFLYTVLIIAFAWSATTVIVQTRQPQQACQLKLRCTQDFFGLNITSSTTGQMRDLGASVSRTRTEPTSAPSPSRYI